MSASQNALDSVSLNALKIENGVFNYVDHKTNKPFTLDGSLVYDGKKISVDVETGRLPENKGELELTAKVVLPSADATLSYGGVVTMSAPYEVQGQVNADMASMKKVATLFGANAADESLKLDGLLTANQNKVDYNNLKVALGSFVGNGKISVQNLQSKNPLVATIDLKSSNVLDVDALIEGSKKSSSGSSTQDLKNTGKTSVKKQNGLLPNSLTLPMPIKADVKLDVGGVKVQGQTIKGVFVDASKDKSKITAKFKTLELPGQGKAEGVLNIQYGSSSQSPKTGQVTYADPTASYKVNGQVGQLEAFLKAFAPKADTKAVTNLYKSAQFNLDGRIGNNAVSLKDSVVKLDDFVIGLGGRYEPAKGNGRAKAIIDVSAGTVDLDKINAAQGKKSNAGTGGNAGAKTSPKEALKPLESFSLPMDLGFDISVQKLRMNGANIEGVRATGDITSNKLTLKNASTNNYAGASMSVKGVVGNIQQLTGLDLEAYVKTQDVKKLASAFKVDTSKLPASLKSLEASVSGKGSIDTLNFSTNLKSMGGALDATGNAANLLGTPSFDNLAVRLKHPNLVRAIQIVSPDFKGGAGLNQAVDFYTKASSNGKVYTLSDMKASLGSTDFGGNLKIDTGAKPLSIRGSIKAGRIALDQLTGGESSSAGSGKSSSGSSPAKKASGERFSKTAIDLGWMKTLDVDVDLAASSITHGKWLLSNPSTDLKIGNGQLTVDDMKAGVFGGNANVSTIVKAEPVSVSMKSAMNNIDLEKLAGALTGGNKLKSSGTVSFTADVSGAGNSAHALVNGLNGSANLDGTNVALKGFDLAKLARGLAVEEKLATSVTSLIDGATRGGETKFDTVKGDYKITNGVANVTSMVMDGASAVIKTTGYADFPKWFVNLDNEISLKGVSDLDPFEVKIKGPLDNPSDTFGKNILEDYLGDKLKRKLAKELPDILGSDVTDKLQKFGILPQQNKQAPAPSNDNTAPAQEAPAEQAPKAEPKKIEKPEDALKQILGGEGSPEDAVNDLIKGLF